MARVSVSELKTHLSRYLREVRSCLEEDPGIVTWSWSSVELASAVERRFREGRLSRGERRRCLDAFAPLAGQWDEVIDFVAMRARA